jgi:hypothetical protein
VLRAETGEQKYFEGADADYCTKVSGHSPPLRMLPPRAETRRLDDVSTFDAKGQ